MHTQFVYLFSVVGYEKESQTEPLLGKGKNDEKKMTCANKDQQMENPKSKKFKKNPEKKCKKWCNKSQQCKFIFINKEKQCFRYSSCKKLRTPTHKGNTYKKKGIYFILHQRDR